MTNYKMEDTGKPVLDIVAPKVFTGLHCHSGFS
jgi:hypothetical protein